MLAEEEPTIRFAYASVVTIADVKADISDQTLELGTANVSALSIEFEEGACPFTSGAEPTVILKVLAVQ